MRNEEYWKEYYESHDMEPPSTFAMWARPRIAGDTVFDVGCGNGRDTVYIKEKHEVIGFDPFAPWVETVTGSLFQRRTWRQMLRVYPPTGNDTLYARWFFHAIEATEQDELLRRWRGQLFVEARDDGGEHPTDHWRRPVDSATLVEHLRQLEYKIDYYKVSNEFSVVGKDKPLLFRVQANRWT